MCGAEMMLHQIVKHLQIHGHTVKVLLKQANQHKIESHYVYDEVDVFPPDQYNETALFQWADIVITHLDYAAWSQALAGIYNKPVIHIIHNSFLRQHLMDSAKPQYLVYNSEWISNEIAYPHEHYVLHPPTDYRHYDVGIDPWDSDYVTLINLDQNKGGEILRNVAAQLPNIKFLGVMGSYSEPVKIGQITQQPDNVKVIKKTTEIRDVYRQTRILIMPSKYESWGRTATEAMCSGIPVIASPTPGLKENCGNAGIFVKDRDNVDEWVKAINKLFDEKTYRKWSVKAKDRSRELDPIDELNGFNDWMCKIIAKWR
jgi:glycosyltransferase involved in cell wall biosynthesis